MTALEEIKKAFPNMFRPLKWHHFDGPTEHGCGEWYAHATRGMYHIYDVREKFPNDRPFYAKELSDQFDTLEQAQDAVQNRHELDIVMCLDPDFRSTLESLQRENDEKSAWIKAATTEITKAIGGGSEMFTKHGDDFRVDPAFVATFIQFRRERHVESKKDSIQKERDVARLRAQLEWYGEQARLARLITSEGDKGRNAISADGGARARATLASTGGEHNGN